MYQVPLYCCMLAPYNCRCRNRAFVLVDSCSHECRQHSSCTTRCATLYVTLRADLLELARVIHWTESIPIWLDQCHFPATDALESTSWKNAADVQLHTSVENRFIDFLVFFLLKAVILKSSKLQTLVVGLPFGKPFLLTFWHSSFWTQWSWTHPDSGKWKRHIEPAKSLHQLLLCLLSAFWHVEDCHSLCQVVIWFQDFVAFPSNFLVWRWCRVTVCYSMKKQ